MAENINLNNGNFDLGMDFDPLSDSDNDILAYGTRISASTSGAGKCHLTPPM